MLVPAPNTLPTTNSEPVEFDYETFPTLSLAEKLKCLPEAMVAEIELDQPFQQVSSHPCALEKHPANHNNGWNCDKITGADRCLSGLTGFYQSTGVAGYRCKTHNYDLCEKCMRADIFIERHGHRED